jgi:phosphate transport system substrate-binding protein
MKSVTIFASLSIFSALFLLVSCSKPESLNNSSSSTPPSKLVLTGSSTVAPLAAEIAKRYEAQHPNVRIDVQSGGSSRGIADARQGLADIGMVSRSLKSGEKDLQAFTIAKDGITVILNKNNPIKELTSKQIIDIYTNKINNWKELGGKDAPITVINKAEGRSTLELFTNHFKLKSSDIKADLVIGENEQGIKTVAGNQNSIAYVSIGSAEYDETHNTPIKLLPIAGIEATTLSVQKGTFPISRPLNLVIKNKPTGLTKEFIDFAQSKEVQDIIKQQYFVPVSPQVAQQKENNVVSNKHS